MTQSDVGRLASETRPALAPAGVRRALQLGTCLTGAAAALIMLAPGSAQAADACGAPVDGVVDCPVPDAGYPDGIHYVVNPVEPQDLTVNLGDGLAIDTSGSNNSGIHVANINGSVTINGEGTTIMTSGTGASGITGVTYVGDLTIHAGDVATSGFQGNGIVASASDGNIAISAGSISTAGDLAYGITVLSDGRGGDVSIDVDSVSTAGNTSKGIDVFAVNGDIGIEAGSVTTIGDDSIAIQAIGFNDVSVETNNILTEGNGSHGIIGFSQYGNLSIDAGQIITVGNDSHGIYALAVDGDTNVTIDRVGTVGYNSAAVIAGSMNGSTTVTAGDVRTTAYGSIGVYAFSGGGDATVNVGDVRTSGIGVQAVSTSGKAIVNAGDVFTQGDYASGIIASGASAEINSTGFIYAHGYGANGAVAIGHAGNATVKSDGIVLTTAPGSIGILGVANGNVTIEANKVYTNASYSTAIEAVAYGGDVNVTANQVGGRGYQSGGILAIAAPTDYYDMTGHDVTVTAGTVKTDGAGPRATGIAALNATYGGNSTVTVTDSVETRRDYADGVLAFAQSGTATVNVKDVSTRGFAATAVRADGATAVIHATGEISTVGDHSSGIRGYATSGGVTLTSSGSISTSGQNSYGMLANGFGPMSLTNSGTIETSGKFSHGMYAIVSPSPTSSLTMTNSGDIKTTGDRSNGIRGITKGGGVTVVSTGTVTVSGDRAIGIVALGDRGGRGGREEAGILADKTVRVDAASVMASGNNSVGIAALNYNGDIIINSAKVAVSGAGSRGINTSGIGKTAINAGSVRSDGIAINSTSAGDVDISVSGAVTSSADTAIVATSWGGNTTVNIGAGGSVIGGGHRVPVYVYGGNGITLASWYGTATVNNAGFVTTTGDGYAIEVIGFSYQPERSALINNSGRIDGAIHVTELDDKFINSGTFNVTKNSNFDLGNDLFTNSGTVKLMTGSAASISFQGLELFDNKGGLVDLTNGHSGDVFTLPGGYIGSGDARLALDVSGSEADHFVVAGAATGKTKVSLVNVGVGNATLTGADPIVIISAGAGSEAGAFELASSDIGFIQYHLTYDEAVGNYALFGTAGSAVYRGAKIGEGLQSVWHQSAGTWAAHMAQLRDTGSSTDRRLWGQMFGQVHKRDEKRSFEIAGGGEETYDLGYRQNYYGGQLGYDLGKGGAFSWGLTAGYANSKLDHAGPGENVKYSVFNLGAYAGYSSGKFFANALLKYDHTSIKATSETLDYSDRFNGGSYGVSVEAGARLGSESFFVEPLAGLSWLSSSIDDLKALGQAIDFDRFEGLRGKLGARIGGVRKRDNGAVLTFYGGASLVHEFAGEDGATLISGDSTDHAGNKRIGTHGQGTLGLNLQSSGGVGGFIEANGELGGGYKGGGGRVGIRVKL